MESIRFEVGRALPVKWPNSPRGPWLAFSRELFHLYLFRERVSESQAEAFMGCAPEFALTPYRDISFLMLRLEGLVDWTPCPYSVQVLSPELWPDHRFPSQESRLGPHLFLVEAETQTLRGLRQVSFSPVFSRAWMAEVNRQKVKPIAREYFEFQAAEARESLSSKELFRRAVARCQGGL